MVTPIFLAVCTLVLFFFFFQAEDGIRDIGVTGVQTCALPIFEPPPPPVPGTRAKLKPNGKAIAPAGAPPQVVAAIEAGNRIRKKPYIYGGGPIGRASGRGRG